VRLCWWLPAAQKKTGGRGRPARRGLAGVNRDDEFPGLLGQIRAMSSVSRDDFGGDGGCLLFVGFEVEGGRLTFLVMKLAGLPALEAGRPQMPAGNPCRLCRHHSTEDARVFDAESSPLDGLWAGALKGPGGFFGKCDGRWAEDAVLAFGGK